jgi:hypothetical protein
MIYGGKDGEPWDGIGYLKAVGIELWTLLHIGFVYLIILHSTRLVIVLMTQTW